MRISDWRSDVCSSDLVVPRNQIYTAFRLETPFRQRLDRLEQTDQRSLVVDGAASPYRLFGDRPGEGRIFPVLFGPLGHWNDVLMRHDDDRRERRVAARPMIRSEEHTSELQSLMRISYAVFCLKKKK